MQNEGEMILAMDGNAKLGLLGETKSRNGRQLEKVFKETRLNLINGTDKCKGKITRQNTKINDEKINLVSSQSFFS